MNGVCRACRSLALSTVLDLGIVPAADHFPLAGSVQDFGHPLSMVVCADCGLAQLADDDTRADEPRGIEPAAVIADARAAVQRIDELGWVGPNTTVREYSSPHGGSWLPWLRDRGARSVDCAADLVVDSFGLMHEPDQKAALAERADLLATDGILVLEVHSFATIVERGQWTALRHGHFAYWSLTALDRALDAAGLETIGCWRTAIYGGSLVVAARRPGSTPVRELQDVARSVRHHERLVGATDASAASTLHETSVRDVAMLRHVLAELGSSGSVAAYGAASRAVSLFAMAGVTELDVAAVVDASPAKWGRRMPGTTVPVVAPEWMYVRRPDRIVVTIPELFDEVRAAHPELADRFVCLTSISAGGSS